MRIDLKRRVPPGADGALEAKLTGLGLGLGAVYSLIVFLVRYSDARAALFTWDGRETVLREGVVMKDFGYLLDKTFLGFVIVALCMVVLAVWHYAGHYQGSRSIYTMRRLPDRWELHRRCLTLPVLGVLGCLVCAVILLLIFYAIYQNTTPEQCLTPHQWQKLWWIWTTGGNIQ